MVVSEDLMSARSVIVAELDKVHPGICKVQSFVRIVDGESVWPEKLFGHQSRPPCTVQTGPFDAWILTPIRPEQITDSGKRREVWKVGGGGRLRSRYELQETVSQKRSNLLKQKHGHNLPMHQW